MGDTLKSTSYRMGVREESLRPEPCQGLGDGGGASGWSGFVEVMLAPRSFWSAQQACEVKKYSSAFSTKTSNTIMN